MTCSYCRLGRHLRCRGRNGCTCGVCFSNSRLPSPEAAPEATPETAVDPNKIPPRPRRRSPGVLPAAHRKSGYSPEVVEAARALKQAGRSWREIGDELDVPVEGLRYAVTRSTTHASSQAPLPVNSGELRSLADSLRESVARAETIIEHLEELIDATR